MIESPKISIFLYLLFLTLTLGCGPDFVIEERHKISPEGWSYADTVGFNFDIRDTNRVFNLFLEVDHQQAFSFQNLYVKVHTIFPSGRRSEQVLSLELADKMGLWQGRCDSENCTLRIPIQEEIFFNEPGKYALSLEQFMRESPLPGLNSFTLLVEDTGTVRQTGLPKASSPE